MIEVELFPRRRPTRIRVFAVLPTGARIKLYERKGLGEVLGLGRELGAAVRAALARRRARPR